MGDVSPGLPIGRRVEGPLRLCYMALALECNKSMQNQNTSFGGDGGGRCYAGMMSLAYDSSTLAKAVQERKTMTLAESV